MYIPHLKKKQILVLDDLSIYQTNCFLKTCLMLKIMKKDFTLSGQETRNTF